MREDCVTGDANSRDNKVLRSSDGFEIGWAQRPQVAALVALLVFCIRTECFLGTSPGPRDWISLRQ